jgi:hypothetical protein
MSSFSWWRIGRIFIMSIPALASIREIFFFCIGHGEDGIQFSIDEIKKGGIG